MKFAIFSLMAILSVSLCTIPEIPGITQGGGLSQITTTTLPPDVISVENLNVIPPSPINAGNQFTMTYNVKSLEDSREVKNVNIALFDYGLCIPNLDNSWTKTGSVFLKSFASFFPQQIEFVEWPFSAPQSSQIGFLQVQCPIRWKVSYDFSAATVIDVDVIAYSRLLELQRSGQSPSFTPTQAIGRGPIKISISYGTTLPIRTSNLTANYKSILPLIVTVENVGDGVYGTIPAGMLHVNKPSEFSVEQSCLDIFSSSGNELTNKNPVTLINKKSVGLRCSLAVPEESITPDPTKVYIEKTFFFNASLDYSYSLQKQVDITVNPLRV